MKLALNNLVTLSNSQAVIFYYIVNMKLVCKIIMLTRKLGLK